MAVTRRLIAARDVRTHKARGATAIRIGSGDLVTPEAWDVARELGVTIARAAPRAAGGTGARKG